MFENPPSAELVPMVIEKTHQGERSFDLFSRLLKDRIVYLGSPVDDNVAKIITNSLLFLEAEDPEKNINLYINSPGGVITSGMAIYDTARYISCPITTICMGQACSMGTFLLACAAEKGRRFAMPETRIMIHQPSGGSRGQATDIQIQAKEIQYLKERLTGLMAKACGQDYNVALAAMERDNFMSAEEALAWGIVDGIMKSKKKR